MSDFSLQKIRSIIGTRIIVIATKTENSEANIYSVFPTRKKEWANQNEVLQLAEKTFDFYDLKFLNKMFEYNTCSSVSYGMYFRIYRRISIQSTVCSGSTVG